MFTYYCEDELKDYGEGPWHGAQHMVNPKWTLLITADQGKTERRGYIHVPPGDDFKVMIKEVETDPAARSQQCYLQLK